MATRVQVTRLPRRLFTLLHIQGRVSLAFTPMSMDLPFDYPLFFCGAVGK